MSLHVPERLPGEDFAQYRARRASSQATVRALLRGQYVLQLGGRSRNRRANYARTLASQAPKFPRERKRKPAELIKPTWPHSVDQKKQGRPLIYPRPLRAAKPVLKGLGWTKHDVACLLAMPKHALDAKVARLLA